MTVAYVVPTVNEYNGDGSTTVFNFTFQVMNYSTDLFVNIVTNSVPVAATGYTVTLNTPLTLPSTGYITFATAPLSGTQVRINRNTYEQRLTNYVAGPIQPNTLNADVDNTVLMIQDVDSQLIPQDGAGNYNLNGAIIRDSGTPLIGSDLATLTSVSNAIAAAASGGQTLVTAGWINITAAPYSADPTGTNDSTSGIQAAINAAAALNTFIYAPNGTYKCTSTLVNTSHTTFQGIIGQSQQFTIFSFAGLTTGDCMKFTDMGGTAGNPNVGYNFANFTITGPGNTAGFTCRGLALPISTNNNSIGTMTSVRINNCPTMGFYWETPITSTFTNLYAYNIGTSSTGDGFHVNGKGGSGAGGTSTTFSGCYANVVALNGFYFSNHNYSAIISCAAGACNAGFYFYECSGINLTGSGIENGTYISGALPGWGVVFNNSSGSSAINVRSYNPANVAYVAYVITNIAYNCSLINCTSAPGASITGTVDATISSNCYGPVVIGLSAPGRTNSAGILTNSSSTSFIQSGNTNESGNMVLNDSQASTSGVTKSYQSSAGNVTVNYNADTTNAGSNTVTTWKTASGTSSSNYLGFKEVITSAGDLEWFWADGSGTVTNILYLSTAGIPTFMLVADQGSGTVYLGNGSDTGGQGYIAYVGSTGITTIQSSGGLKSSSTITAATGMTVTSGNITITSGNLDITAGNIVLSDGAITASGLTTTGDFVMTGGTPTGALTGLGLGNTTGFGNGSSGTGMTTTTKSTGTGPSTPQTVVGYMQINVGGTNYWIPYCS